MQVVINGIIADIEPYYDWLRGPQGSFTSRPDTAASEQITVTFSQPVSSVTVNVFDADFGGDVIAVDSNNRIITTRQVFGDETPGLLTEFPVTITTPTPQIKTLFLNAAPADFVYYTITGVSAIITQSPTPTPPTPTPTPVTPTPTPPTPTPPTPTPTPPTPTPTPTPVTPTPSTTPVPTPIIIPPTPTPTIPPTPVPTLRVIKEKSTIRVLISVTIVSIDKAIKISPAISITITPAPTVAQKLEIVYPFIVNTLPISINISDPLIESAYEFLETAIETYIDEDRELKTLLNYGEDRQSVALAYRYGPLDQNNIRSIQLKLLQPVPNEISLGNNVFLGREVAKSVIDKVRVRFAPPLDATPYLRPKNLKAYNGLDTGKSLSNITLNKLSLQSGSVGIEDVYKNKSFEDEIFRQWYSYDFNSAELNIDFTDYTNFIFYGSATMRVAAFKEKLYKLETIENNRIQFLSSSTYVGTTGSAGFVFVQQKTAEYAKEKEDIIRGFDRYEQYLYFTPSGSNSPYTASAYYADEGYEYNSIGYWPKNISGSLLPTYDEVAVNWYDTQLAIAQRFDEFNENNLVNTIPTHIREHEESAAYITFVTMTGHFFDIIKPYIDKFPEIYSRALNPNKELSKDLVNEIAESFGFKLPSLNSTYELTNNILGIENAEPRRDTAAEIYKRLLHNLPFFAKAKGTKTGLETFLKTFGITSQLISVKELGTPSSGSYNVFDEFSTGLDFDVNKQAFIRLPLSASARNPRTLQLNATFADSKHMTLMTGDNRWAVNVNVHPLNNNLGRIEVVSGSSGTILMSSSYYELFGDELINITLQNYSTTASLYVRYVDAGEIVYESISHDATNFVSLWESTQYVYLGGSGPLVVTRYNGTIDEVRMWADVLSDETILNTTYDPASNAGDTYSSAADYLVAQISFNNLNTGSLTGSVLFNESPYKNKLVSPTIDTFFTFNISGSDFSRYNRVIRQETPQAGSSGYVINKIKVADTPKFLNSSQGLRLYRNKSIVEPTAKRLQRGRNKVILSMSPTEIINQNIIRSFGLENINSVLGAPTTLYTAFNKSLDTLKRYYQQYYYVDVDTNKFIRILSEFGSILDQVVDYFIPSKATVLRGIVIEPNILEQVKIPPIKDIRFYGKNTRKTLDAPGSLSGSKPEYGATFNVTKTIKTLTNTSTSGSYETYTTYLEDEKVIPILTGSTNNWRGSVNVGTDLLEATVSNYTSSMDTIQPKIITGSYNFHVTKINVEKEILSGSNGSYTARIKEFIRVITSGSYNTYSGSSVNTLPTQAGSYLTVTKNHESWNYDLYQTGSLILSQSNKPQRQSFVDLGLATVNKFKFNSSNYGNNGAEPYGRIYTRKLFTSEITKPRHGGTGSLYTPALNEIPPIADFNDFGVYTFFSDPKGIYYFTEVNKKPAYKVPLNQQWNESSQTFEGITTWSYGNRYNQHDVVYQDVKYQDLQQLGPLASSSITYGNKLYYVFKTKPSYRPSTDGTSFYVDDVPSYTPPSLDKENWEILRFTPTQKRVPKRVIFDTFTVINPALNNFKTTTISINKLINIPDRYVDEFDLESVSSLSYATGEITINNIAILFGLQTNVDGIRLRFYRTSQQRDADISRPINVRPTNDHGVLVDVELSELNKTKLINPVTTLIAGNTPPAGKIYYTINNLGTNPKGSIKLLMYYFAVEIEPRIPVGYLRKHYRFFRDNSTATKRRNYEGCKNDQTTTIDGLPAVQVFISEGTDLVRSATQTNDEIITGGGGTLNAT